MKKFLLNISKFLNLFRSTYEAQTEKTILQLKEASQDSFGFPLTDRERFGVDGSTAFMNIDLKNSIGIFFGELKINEGAGFASYRKVVELNIADFDRLQIRVKGDGREYKVLIKDANALLSLKAYSHQASFKTLKNEEQIVSIEFKSFQPAYRGKINNSLPNLDLSNVRELGIQINDGVAGPFRLEFNEWIVQK